MQRTQAATQMDFIGKPRRRKGYLNNCTLVKYGNGDFTTGGLRFGKIPFCSSDSPANTSDRSAHDDPRIPPL
jgi:hypothetical protein